MSCICSYIRPIEATLLIKITEWAITNEFCDYEYFFWISQASTSRNFHVISIVCAHVCKKEVSFDSYRQKWQIVRIIGIHIKETLFVWSSWEFWACLLVQKNSLQTNIRCSLDHFCSNFLKANFIWLMIMTFNRSVEISFGLRWWCRKLLKNWRWADFLIFSINKWSFMFIRNSFQAVINWFDFAPCFIMQLFHNVGHNVRLRFIFNFCAIHSVRWCGGLKWCIRFYRWVTTIWYNRK